MDQELTRSRVDLHQILVDALGSGHVYFQPPPNIVMQYPCIVYKRDRLESRFADNLRYLHKKGYQVVVIDRDPDSEIPEKIADLPYCSFDRFYTANDLNHDVFTLFF